MHGDKVQKGKFRVQNVTKKLLAYRIRVSQKDNLVSWEVKNGAAVLKPGQSRQVSVFMPPGNHIEDLVHVHVFQGEAIYDAFPCIYIFHVASCVAPYFP